MNRLPKPQPGIKYGGSKKESVLTVLASVVFMIAVLVWVSKV